MGFEKSFKALSDPVRREILQLLRNGAMTAGNIAEHFDMTKATISYHLRLLKEAGLIFEEKEKNFIYYDLNTTLVEEMMGWLMSLKERKND
ncbi:autorepressor SdpR family transcription factor [Weissella sagaensis]|jgi:DNA-binding transcriptional ArsR family regulator|uniref:Autorepressor SdpR family transcription factor n=1 Tax=Weissella sagaensis TaxID=2559928 RepID=A0ABW1RUL0_9LACO|nr:autorepressor SdpR family transcription factor [Weissella sagaensis]KAA8434645.1 winged helix-turn-helix transcriptional regulator [Weissella paramesenteroides]MBU7567429.1 winged helix-turn-helix transcriptional regulator [Weissella hellenica]KAA8437604.1 winged helix-turn-helix transcriptional regulator [Weissella paramesenteroides]QDJ59462.1 ArsR family transcriptional regulator [Weissella hellenica]QEA56775.1 winged helix-turn-helix transcriptional regulator [Weissella hellenica]